MTPELQRPELQRLAPADRIGHAPLTSLVEADPAECRAIAARLRIPEVLALACRFTLRRADGGTIDAEGELRARVVRECVVSLEPFEMAVAEDFTVRFVPAGSETDDDDPLTPDEIPYQGGAIDLGEAAVEQLALALDPFPRNPLSVLPDTEADEGPGNVFRQAFQTRGT
jgi:uncharacterized metal-binding protein YceD (DUF177 family)